MGSLKHLCFYLYPLLNRAVVDRECILLLAEKAISLTALVFINTLEITEGHADKHELVDSPSSCGHQFAKSLPFNVQY